MTKVLFGLITTATVSYLLICLALYTLQVRLLFPGQPLPKNFTFRDLEGTQEVLIPISEGHLSALHYKNQSPKGLIFFLHGNAGNLDSWVPDVDFYREEAFDLFMIDYRGYGKSDGRIRSQQQLIDDVFTAWQQVSPAYRENALPIMIYGRSIGTFLATDLASKVQHDALVLVSPYFSLQQLVREKLPWIPSFILRFKLNTAELLNSSDTLKPTNVHLIHGTEDEVIPVTHSRQLSLLLSSLTSSQPKESELDGSLIEVRGAAHNDIHDFPLYQTTMSTIARSIHR